jgi:hypothetical protein
MPHMCIVTTFAAEKKFDVMKIILFALLMTLISPQLAVMANPNLTELYDDDKGKTPKEGDVGSRSYDVPFDILMQDGNNVYVYSKHYIGNAIVDVYAGEAIIYSSNLYFDEYTYSHIDLPSDLSVNYTIVIRDFSGYVYQKETLYY